MNKFLCLGIVLWLTVSCEFFKSEAKPEAIARVNDSYLNKDDIIDLIPAGTTTVQV